jgi:uncharacterized protein YxeA
MSKIEHSPKSEISIIKRRDPKSMTMEELDEFLNKNKSKIKNDDSKLNVSFTSYKTHTLNEVQKNLNKTSDNILRKDIEPKSFIINQSYNPFIKENNSYDPVSDTENRFKAKYNNSATNSYIKSLQEKIRQLTAENHDVKQNFIEVSELLEHVINFNNRKDQSFNIN